MQPALLFTNWGEDIAEEVAAAELHLPVRFHRTDLHPNTLVIGRYCVLPFYRDLEYDLGKVGSQLINTYDQHRFTADLGQWVPLLSEWTPKTWGSLAEVPDDAYPIVLKGETNSRKFSWDRAMFAADKAAATEVLIALHSDSLISSQHIYARQYLQLETVADRIATTMPPIANEHRVFVLDGVPIASGFYWVNAVDDDRAKELTDSYSSVVTFMAKLIALRIKDRCRFYALDFARDVNNKWWLIDIADGQMAGTVGVDRHELYRRMALVLNGMAS